MGDYTNVTEIPGQGATSDQLSIMMTRYNLAKKFAEGKNVLEIACGSGTGLGYIAQVAKSVVGGDIDNELVDIASANYNDDPKVSVQYIDAQNLPFCDNSFDTVLLFEAIYYIPDIDKFIAETQRVIRPEGTIIIASVNCQWHGFNPSSFSIKYYTALELLNMFEVRSDQKLLMGFEDLPKGNNYIISLIRRIAVGLGLIPKTMKGKELLKRVFYGKLKQIPKVLYDGLGRLEPLIPFDLSKLETYKQLYLIVHIAK